MMGVIAVMMVGVTVMMANLAGNGCLLLRQGLARLLFKFVQVGLRLH